MTPAQLKRRRASLGWSQTRLAEALGVTRNTINRWEMGVHPIPPMASKLMARLENPPSSPEEPLGAARKSAMFT
jgi:transcriptional regulator with XRE-family HTH domain